MDLHASRTHTGMGTPQGISYQEILACAAVRGRRLYRVQVEAIRALDQEYLTSIAERMTVATSGKSDG